MADNKLTAIYISLICVGVFISTMFAMTLVYNKSAFIVMLALYMIGYSIYVFITLFTNRKKLDENTKYMIATYITFYNIFLMFAIFVLAIVFHNMRIGSQFNQYSR